MSVTLYDTEMDLLWEWWPKHRLLCHGRDLTIEHRDGGGIGSVTIVTCSCGAYCNITDYSAW